MVFYEKSIFFILILPTFWYRISMTMLAQSRGLVNVGFVPQNVSKEIVKSVVECQLKCDMDPLCMSYFYSKIENNCSIHNVGFVDDTVLIAEEGWIYMQSISDKCPRDYFYAKAFGRCYALHKNENLTNDYAAFKSYCEKEGAEILKIDSQPFAEHIKTFMVQQTDALTNFAINGHWNGSMWVYDDGVPVTYFRWRPSKPYGNTNYYSQIFMRARANFEWNNRMPYRADLTCGFLCGKLVG